MDADDLFLSYARENRGFAADLAGELQRRGWTLWWDRHLRAGDSFALEIQARLRAAKAVLVLWSKVSVVSVWVNNEARDAMRRHVLIPVRIEAVDLPVEFNGLHTVDLSDWRPSQAAHSEFEDFVDAIQRIAPPRAKPALVSVATPAVNDPPVKPRNPKTATKKRPAQEPEDGRHPSRVEARREDLALLEEINLEMGQAENVGDTAFFEGLLAHEFILEGANGALVTRRQFLSELRSGGDHITEVDRIEFPTRMMATVHCLLIAGGQRYRSKRTFVRDSSGSWKLINCANEPDWAAA